MQMHRDSRKPSLDMVMHAVLGMVFIGALALAVAYPQWVTSVV